MVLRILSFLLVVVLQCASPALAADAPDAWFAEADRIRLLAEQDVPQAREEAQKLAAALPQDATLAQKVRLLNLQSRIENYLAQTEIARRHADAALELAERNDDRRGQAEAHLNMALISINQGRIDTAAKASSQALILLKGLDQPVLLCEALLRNTVMYRRNGQIDASVSLAVKARDIAQQIKDPLALAYVFQGLAITYEQGGQALEAKAYYAQMREKARAAGTRQLEAYALLGYANTAITLGGEADAINAAQEAIALFRATGAPFNLNFALFNYATLLRKQGNHAGAAAQLDQVVQTYTRYPNPIGLWWALQARAGDLRSLDRTAQAEADTREAYRLAEKIGFPLYRAESARSMATVATAQGNHSLASDYLREALDMNAQAERQKISEQTVLLAERYLAESKQSQIDELTRREQQRTLEQRWLWTILVASTALLALTSGFLHRQRKLNRALTHLNTQLGLREHEFRTLAENAPDIIIRYDGDARPSYVNRAYLEAAAQSALPHALAALPGQQAPAPGDYQQLLAKVIATGESVEIQLSRPLDGPGKLAHHALRIVAERSVEGRVFGALAIGRDITALIEAEDKLRESSTQLRELAARRDTAREEERKRIARELHDELGQTLTAFRLDIATLKFQFGAENPALEQRCQHLLHVADRTIQVVRNVASTLRPATLDMGTVPALEWLAAEFRARTGVECRLSISDVDASLDETQSVAVFRIVQESLTNVTRHAQACRVDISLHPMGEYYRLRISDDGVGFQSSNVSRRSFGLVGIRERALMINGHARVTSAPGRGTTVEVDIPREHAVDTLT